MSAHEHERPPGPVSPISRITRTMEHAPAAILELVKSRSWEHASGVVRVVGITGAVASGKSTLAAKLSSCVLSTDDYLPDYDRTPEHLRDLPEMADLARLLDDLRSLRAGKRTRVPRWSFETHSRVGEREVEPGGSGLVVVEGLHALHAAHATAVDVRVFVDAPAALRRARWEARERAGDRGWDVAYALEFFDRVAEPTFARFAPAYRESAHVIVESA
jgi:uridine kinase